MFSRKLSFVLVLVLLVTTLFSNRVVLAEEADIITTPQVALTISGNDILEESIEQTVSSNEVFSQESRAELISEVTNPYIWETTDVQVEHHVTSTWGNNYQCEMKITNLGGSVIEDWSINFQKEDTINSIWGAQIVSDEHGSYILKNAGWNKDILPGKTVCFGFSASYGERISVPMTYIVEGETEEIEDLFVWESEDFSVQHDIVDKWDGGYQCEITITNIGENTIEDWNIMFQCDNTIERIWNANVLSYENETYVIDNVRWNGDIETGESVAFGYVASYSEDITIPETFGISGTEKELVDSSYEIVYEISDMYSEGYTGQITIKNLSDKEFRNWKLMFDLEDNIIDIWNATINSYENGRYEIYYASYNSTIPAGESVSFGFRVEDSEFNMYPDNYAVKVVVHNSMRTDLVDEVIGVAYVEPISSGDYRIESDGIQYVANQINLVGEAGTTFQQVADLGEEYGFEIVGYIQLTNDYQIKFVNDKTYEELNTLLAEFESNSLILEANLNLITEVETASINYPNDIRWKMLWDDVPGGHNWGVEAINAPEAWRYEDEMTVVKIGVHDNMFDEQHEDLTFTKVWNNAKATEQIISAHGTHVAGTMAADFNNGVGISGIAIKKELYGYACAFSMADETDSISPKLISDVMDYKYSFALMIGNGVRVINVSYGSGDLQAFAASQGNENAKRHIQSNAEVLDNYLNRLVERGYDFVFVVAAGNTNNRAFVQDGFAKYGYREGSTGEEVLIGNVDAQYSHFLNCCKKVKDRIIVVGAYELDRVENEVSYKMINYSNTGTRVDVVAPGMNIDSTITGNKYEVLEGTSMASPHVSGVAALVYSINPELSGVQVKKIICNTRQVEPLRGIVTYKIEEYDVWVPEDSTIYYSVDALAAVEEARETMGDTPILGENTGFILGHVDSAISNKAIEGALICAYKYSSYDGNVGNGEVTDYQYVTETDSYGNYSLELDPGEYRVMVSYGRYTPLVISYIKILPNEVNYQESIMYIDDDGAGLFGVNGTVTDALTGQTISGAIIKARHGWNKTSGMEGMITTETDANGNYLITLAAGYYTLEVSKDGYIKGYANIVSYGNAASQAVVLSPILAENEMRIVLTWGEIPSDLDSHVAGYTKDKKQFHVYFGNKVYYNEQRGNIVTLDRDDTTSYGPETTTVLVDLEDISSFKYYVHHYGGAIGSSQMSFSGARITVYYGSKEPVVYHVPINQAGLNWDVFKLTEDGEIKVINTIK